MIKYSAIRAPACWYKPCPSASVTGYWVSVSFNYYTTCFFCFVQLSLSFACHNAFRFIQVYLGVSVRLQVNVFKLLGVLLDDNLKFNYRVDAVCATKALSRLHFLKILQRSSLGACDLFYFYTSFISPLLEYACPAWHKLNSLTNARLSLFRI